VVVAFFNSDFCDEIHFAARIAIEPAHVHLDGEVGVGRDGAVLGEHNAAGKSLFHVLREDTAEHLIERGRPAIGVHDPHTVIDNSSDDLGAVEVAGETRPAEL
jgi:hypothetical protein